MARIILKSPNLKPNRKVHIENYTRYIATREGAELAEDTTGHLPATQRQRQLLQKLLKKYPDSKEFYEYEDYLAKPTRENAEELLQRILETHGDALGSRENYVSYIAGRPGVEKTGAHGLFTDEGVPVVLPQVAKEMAESQSNIWTHIISLRREDAERLGYNTAEAWMQLLRSQRNRIARQMKIAPENFRWYAAFHNAGHHPHVHMMAYSIDPKEAYLTTQGIAEIKSGLAREIFRQDLISVYQRQTEYRDALRQQGRENLSEIVEQIHAGTFQNPELEKMLFKLADQLSRFSGKKVYGYLKPEMKAIVDAIVAELSQDDRISKLYDLWYEQREAVIRTYTDALPERIPLEQNKEFKSIRNAVIQEALKLCREPEADPECNLDLQAVHFSSGEATEEFPSRQAAGHTTPDSNPHPSKSAALASLRLFQQLGQLLQTRIQQERRLEQGHVDRKLKRRLDEKKQAQGIRD